MAFATPTGGEEEERSMKGEENWWRDGRWRGEGRNGFTMVDGDIGDRRKRKERNESIQKEKGGGQETAAVGTAAQYYDSSNMQNAIESKSNKRKLPQGKLTRSLRRPDNQSG